MKAAARSVVLGGLLALTHAAPVVDTMYPYTGPDVPVGDWVDPTVNGNGKGFPRLVEPPAVTPASANPTNNINVISLAYLPTGMNIHFQTPFGLGENEAPSVRWGTSPEALDEMAAGISRTYDRTPPCSSFTAITQCSQWFHDVQIKHLAPSTTYYYQILASNGTTASDIEKFTTARPGGDTAEFSIAVLNDMGYTNAAGTMQQLQLAVDSGTAFVWHGGDISYADDWYSGILPCEDSWPVCYNGSSSELPGGVVDNPDYDLPLPDGEVPNQGGPNGGDMSVIYESNWDLWQQWTNSITTKVPYMVMPGNHEASCSEYDGTKGQLAAYLNDDRANSTADAPDYLTYYSCPESQRNFTAYINRFKMPGGETGGVGNFWYSFDYGLAHFISIDGETDYAYSPEWPFLRDDTGTETHPTEAETYPNDSGPFGTIDDDAWKVNTGYQQYKWLAKDLAAINRTATPWVIAMSHRPMYSSSTSSYQTEIRSAFQGLLLQYGVDAYLSGHIHWYERMYPLTSTGAVDTPSVIDKNTYYTNAGISMTHIINGMAGNIESHSVLSGAVQPKTAVLDMTHYGFNKLTFYNATAMKFDFILGKDGSSGDEVTLIKPAASSGSSSSSSSSTSSSTRRPCGSSSSASISATTTLPQTSSSSSSIESSSAISTSPQASSSSSSIESSSAISTSSQASSSSSSTQSSSVISTSSQASSSSSSIETSSVISTFSQAPSSSSSTESSSATTTASSQASSSVTSTEASSSIISSSSSSSAKTSLSTNSVTSSSIESATSAPSQISSTSTVTPASSQASLSSSVRSSASTSSLSSAQTLSASDSGASTATGITVSSSVPYTISTIMKTVTSTISSCAPTITNCPYNTAPIYVTETVVDYTTYCPVDTSTTAAETTNYSIPHMASTVYKTIISTISSCDATVKDCPYTTAPIAVTSVVIDSTTNLPVVGASVTVSAPVYNTETSIASIPGGLSEPAVSAPALPKTTTSTPITAVPSIVAVPTTEFTGAASSAHVAPLVLIGGFVGLTLYIL